MVRVTCGNALVDRGECVEELLEAPKVWMEALPLLGPRGARPRGVQLEVGKVKAVSECGQRVVTTFARV
ncbi:hypothetical protein RAM_15485 [Amycolatopsis mediterranei S699]|uniref:Uncharacterized protein n=1 Tax=Amycolatopsis mediterranei (strain S699) TaxID=713604 RepID=A0A9R0NVU3_AMYMS|nr:hypothetical protein RAM_15485 [Amycolatopsis mediterranei S699]